MKQGPYRDPAPCACGSLLCERCGWRLPSFNMSIPIPTLSIPGLPKMLNPHEETWTAHKDCVVMPEGWRTILRTHEDMLDGQERERAQLAAQAPAMARLLLEIHGDHEQMAAGRYDALEAVLRAAGVLP